MANEIRLSAFEWQVATHGHHWVATRPAFDQAPSEQQFLTAGVPVGGMIRVKRYFPFEEETALFRIFAGTALEPEAIRSFADTYGLLGSIAQPIQLPETRKGNTTQTGEGERLDDWKLQIIALRRCVELHDWAVDQNLEALSEVITWRDDSVVYMSHLDPGAEPSLGGKYRMIAGKKLFADVFERMTEGDLVRPALNFVQAEVDERLRNLTAARLLWDRKTDKLVNVVMPNSLLGALWQQFAFAIERGSRFRQCAECGKWFELSPRTARSDKLFCSDACRVRAYRRRKAEAEDLGTASIAEPAAKPGAGSNRTGPGSGGPSRRRGSKA